MLTTWVVYDHPADYPAHFVVRPWEITGNEARPGGVQLFEDMDGVRAFMLGMGLFRLDRQEEDDPAIMEVWV